MKGPEKTQTLLFGDYILARNSHGHVLSPSDPSVGFDVGVRVVFIAVQIYMSPATHGPCTRNRSVSANFTDIQFYK